MISRLEDESPEGEFDVKAVTAEMCLGKAQVTPPPAIANAIITSWNRHGESVKFASAPEVFISLPSLDRICTTVVRARHGTLS